MGIDVYAVWKGRTMKEAVTQVPDFSVVHGHVGYLREAYHGGPYATRHLCEEAFRSETAEAAIPAAVLRRRLPETLRLVEERERRVYGATDPAAVLDVKRSFIDFVELCEAKERTTGEPVTIRVSW